MGEWRRTTLLGLTSTLLLPACAPSGDGPAPEPEQPTAQVQEEQVDVDDLVADLEAGLGRSTTVQLSLDVDAGGERMVFTGVADYGRPPVDLAGTVRYRSWREDQERWREMEYDARLVDEVAYLGRRDRFVSFDLAEPEALPEWFGPFLDLLDPLADLDDLGDAASSAVTTGVRTIAGEELTRYVLVVDPAEMPALRSFPSPGELPDEVEYAVWVDEQQRVRELSTLLELEDQVLSVKVRMTAWDNPVTIEVPERSVAYEPPTEEA